VNKLAVMSTLLIGVAAIALAAASPGSTSTPPLFSKGDLPRLVAPRPPLPTGTEWLDVTTSDGDSRNFGLAWFEQEPLISEMRSAGFQRGYSRSWSADTIEPYDYRTVEGRTMLFRTAAGARAGLAALKRAVAGGGRPQHWPEFGVDSFGIATLGKKPVDYYAWRVVNVILLASAYCDVECEFEVVPVNRAYARVLNVTARRKS
jgi:hypothetical protein